VASAGECFVSAVDLMSLLLFKVGELRFQVDSTVCGAAGSRQRALVIKVLNETRSDPSRFSSLQRAIGFQR
jgi:hypothetical protein